MTRSPKDVAPGFALAPPAESRGLLSDLELFVFTKPAIPTLIRFSSETERENYRQRIVQRLGISVEKYAILNIHRIGIEAPVQHVFRELLRWDAGSLFWPNHLATVERREGHLQHIRVYLLGGRRRVPGFRNGLFGLHDTPLFVMDAIKFQEAPPSWDVDNARYLLYECSGGYPIGIFATYVRSPIAAEAEVEPTQAFFVVGFNIHGRREWSGRHLVTATWEKIHNRVTANILNRFKMLCEANFQEVRTGRAL